MLQEEPSYDIHICKFFFLFYQTPQILNCGWYRSISCGLNSNISSICADVMSFGDKKHDQISTCYIVRRVDSRQYRWVVEFQDPNASSFFFWSYSSSFFSQEAQIMIVQWWSWFMSQWQRPKLSPIEDPAYTNISVSTIINTRPYR